MVAWQVQHCRSPDRWGQWFTGDEHHSQRGRRCCHHSFVQFDRRSVTFADRYYTLSVCGSVQIWGISHWAISAAPSSADGLDSACTYSGAIRKKQRCSGHWSVRLSVEWLAYSTVFSGDGVMLLQTDNTNKACDGPIENRGRPLGTREIYPGRGQWPGAGAVVEG